MVGRTFSFRLPRAAKVIIIIKTVANGQQGINYFRHRTIGWNFHHSFLFVSFNVYRELGDCFWQCNICEHVYGWHKNTHVYENKTKTTAGENIKQQKKKYLGCVFTPDHSGFSPRLNTTEPALRASGEGTHLRKGKQFATNTFPAILVAFCRTFGRSANSGSSR